MATLAEINTVINDSTLTDKIRGACIKTAVAINFEDPQTANHAARMKWAKSAFSDPVGMATKVNRYIVAANADLELLAIQGLSDAAIQSHTDASVNVFLEA